MITGGTTGNPNNLNKLEVFKDLVNDLLKVKGGEGIGIPATFRGRVVEVDVEPDS